MTILPFVISGLICAGIWVGALGWRRHGWLLCIAGHISFMAYGVLTGHYGFFIVPPFSALGLAIGIYRARYDGWTRHVSRKSCDCAVNIDSTPDTINIEDKRMKEER